MSDALLAGILRRLRLEGTVYFKADFQCPWGMAVPAKEFAFFHVVVTGRAWIRSGEETLELQPGEIVLLPQGTAHELLSDPEVASAPAEEVIGSLAEHEDPDLASAPARESTRLVCGHFSYDQTALHPLFLTLPAVVRVRPQESVRSEWLATAAELAASESRRASTEASVVVDRLAEALLLQTLRLHLEQSKDQRSFLAGTVDRIVGPALTILHEDPAHRWTVAELANRVACSESALTRRFRSVVGESPIRYLTRWRMLLARDLLATTDASLAEVADQVGYDSEFAFAKAFKRVHGLPPGEFRRTA